MKDTFVIYPYTQYEYEAHPLFFLDLCGALSPKTKVELLALLDRWYGDTDQETTDWALEYQLWARMLLHSNMLLLNPQHLDLSFDPGRKVPYEMSQLLAKDSNVLIEIGWEPKPFLAEQYKAARAIPEELLMAEYLKSGESKPFKIAAKSVEQLKIAKAAYLALYNDQLEGADDDYEEYFKSTFAPSLHHWTDLEKARSALQSLINELYEDRTDVKELLEACGVTAEFAVALGLNI